MCAKPFYFSEADDIIGFAIEGLLAVVDQAGLFDEVVH